MIDRTVFTHELEAAAHRCAAMSAACGHFHFGASDGALQYVGFEKDGEQAFYSLINGEWTEMSTVAAGGDAQ